MYKIFISEHFKKQLKVLSKKDQALKTTLQNTLNQFHKEHVIAIGQGIYKLRLKKNGRGKSGGYRLYVVVLEVDGILAPICIYAKSQKALLSKKDLDTCMDVLVGELEEIIKK